MCRLELEKLHTESWDFYAQVKQSFAPSFSTLQTDCTANERKLVLPGLGRSSEFAPGKLSLLEKRLAKEARPSLVLTKNSSTPFNFQSQRSRRIVVIRLIQEDGK